MGGSLCCDKNNKNYQSTYYGESFDKKSNATVLTLVGDSFATFLFIG